MRTHYELVDRVRFWGTVLTLVCLLAAFKSSGSEQNNRFEGLHGDFGGFKSSLVPPDNDGTYIGMVDVHIDNKFYSLAPDVFYRGPVIEAGNEKTNQEYVRNVFRDLVFSADQLIHDHPEYGYGIDKNKNYSYYTFLVTVLATAHHESRLVHFRRTHGRACVSEVNNLSAVGLAQAKSVLKSHYRKPYSVLFPDCRYMKNNPKTIQVLNSGQHADLGIMQVNAKYHPVAAQPSIYLNTHSSIQFGVEYLFEGYELLRSTYQQHSCGFDFNPFQKTQGMWTADSKYSKPYFNLIRATWSARHNQGSVRNTRKVCRFSRDHPFDVDFLYKTLEPMIVGGNSVYHRYLPEGSLERHAFLEIVNNFKNIYTQGVEDEKDRNLKKMLSEIAKQRQETPFEWEPPSRESGKPQHRLVEGTIPIRSKPSFDFEDKCGVIENENGQKANIVVSGYEEYGHPPTGERHKWAVVQLPEYASFAYRYSVDPYVELEPGQNVVNVRSKPTTQCEDCRIGQLKKDGSGSVEGPLQYVGFVKDNKDYPGRVEDQNERVWFKAKTDKGQTVYVHASLTRINENKGSPDGECDLAHEKGYYVLADLVERRPVTLGAGEIGKGIVKKFQSMDEAFIRKERSGDAEIIETVKAGESIIISDKKKNRVGSLWYKVRTDDPRYSEGWIYSGRVKLVDVRKETDKENW